MDANNFRTQTTPNYYTGAAKRISKNPVTPIQTEPTADARFPQWAAPMSDGRLTTDYRPNCAKNVAAGSQYGTKQWMIHSAEAIMAESRQRQTRRTGAGHPFDSSVVPPPAAIAKCTPFSCGIVPVSKDGIGLERGEGCPSLFGTFAESGETASSVSSSRTRRYEGGRNTPRG
jgi:hypothetical protein